MKKARYHHGDLRAALIEAARLLVEQNGAERLTMSDASRAAGVSTAAPYRYFHDKDALLDAVALEGLERQRQAMLQAGAAHPLGSEAAVSAIGHAYIDFATAERGVFKLMFSQTRTHGRSPELLQKGKETFGVLLSQLAHREGGAPNDPPIRTRGLRLWTFVHGLSFLLIDDKVSAMEIPLDLSEMVADATRRFLQDS
ncbi:TetR/AcrR family transcriptional regulator [Falsiroseomonas sp.]|uniref:TetR/AcrR family transcriptional regulator n=1 Tax=Falsiroseomonas sp. TaxID=2870721 RepID=UPI002722240C|nr:TetR/AcrR family transcriptional regulator [Falsiroseomonas sp.]MDO9499466.1 TetR/AcrR family transcriptional regulator [Falsiroseomonas sp.]